MAPFKNNFSWSHSRGKMFRECLRHYYWHYYGSWEGWRQVAPESARLAYRLKQMVTTRMWAGDVVHRVIEAVLRSIRSGGPTALDEAKEQGRQWLNREWAQSVNKQWRRDPKRNLNLFEHYYGKGISKEERAELREHIFNCLGRFYEGEAFERLKAAGPDNWLSIEALESFDLLGVPFWVKLDIAAREDGAVAITDWKTGRPTDDDGLQARIYALYSMDKWKTPPEQITARVVYLADGEEAVFQPKPDELIEQREKVAAEVEQGRLLLSDIKENVALIENFPMTDELTKCDRCSFQELCSRGAAAQ